MTRASNGDGNGHPRGHPRTRHPSLSQTDLRRVATGAGCDPRTIVRYLWGAPLWSTTRGRIEEALRACGFARLVQPESRSR